MPRLSQSQSQPNNENETISIETEKEIVQSILYFDCTKKPFKISDIISALSVKPSRKDRALLVSKAKTHLTHLGIELLPTEKTDTYITVSTNLPVPWVHEYLTCEQRAERTMLFIILAYLLMHENCVLESDLIQHLSVLNIWTSEGKLHAYFGDVQKMVTKHFVEQLYLEIIKTTDTTFQFKWGLRALAEISMKDVLEKVCLLGFNNRRKPEDFPTQSKLAAEQD